VTGLSYQKGNSAVQLATDATGTPTGAGVAAVQGTSGTTLTDLGTGKQVTVVGAVDTSNLQAGQSVAVTTPAGTYHVDPATGDVTDSGAITATINGPTVTLLGLGGTSPFALISNDNSVSTASAVSSNGTITLEAGETIYLSGTGDVINKNGGTVVQLGASALPPSGNSAVSITAPMSRTFLGLASSGPSVGEPGGGGSVVLWGTTNEIDGSGYSIAA
jgi:hypothetical protein